MAFIAAIQLAELKEKIRITKTMDNHKIMFVWHNDKIHAFQSQCPHLKLPLTKAQINENNELTCPFHHSKFDLCTGEVKCWSSWPPVVGSLLGRVSKEKNLKIYETKVENETVMVNL